MNSSTSSSSSGEWRVVLALAVLLLLAEGVMRLAEPHLSKNIAHLRSLPQTAAELRAHQGKKVLLVGNSLTRNAVNAEQLTAAYPADAKVKVFSFLGDATSAVNWDYGLRRYFLHADAMPDEVLLGTGPLHLHDVPGDGSRLGAYFVAKEDLGRAMQTDLPSWDEKCEFLMSRYSALHATRLRVKPHVFGRLVPHYFEMEQWINTQRDVARQRSGKADFSHVTHRHLEQILADCKAAGVKLSIFSVPLPEPYEVPAPTIEVIKQGGAQWLPLSDMPGLTKDNFPDGYHLDPAGAQVFTKRLVEAMKTTP